MTNLVTLQEYKAYKGITNNKEDSSVAMIITNVSKLVKTYCSRSFIDFVVTPKVEKFDARVPEVMLSEVPLLSVSSVKTSTDGGLTQVTLTEADPTGAGYFVDQEEGLVLTQVENENFLGSVTTPYRSLEVSYLAGYTDANGNAEVPADLKLAVLDMISYYINDEKKDNKSMGAASITNVISVVDHGFPAHIVRILQLYRLLDL